MQIEFVNQSHVEIMETHRSNMIEYLNKVHLSNLNKARFYNEIQEITRWLRNFKTK